ncbi:benzoate/H(+) symporter BenE family transporter [Aeromicrobium piscarium]|uniref:Benzoate transporter n=1 Tax=Aeromicrobium piscarium TaxID=2590901 RepID=A0A554RMC3_9ACTN|nr:benzoate/H(+) symporter BenE family transporter [Aeromicrobium piscarium]TSD55287.1 benzoate transporter [Aeromicrobium piscarium]
MTSHGSRGRSRSEGEGDGARSRRWLGIESGPGYRSGLRDFTANLNVFTIVTGVVPVFVICLSVSAVLIASGSDAGLSTQQITFWASSIYVFGGILSWILAPYYKLPIVGAFSIPGVVVAIGALGDVSYSEMLGGILVAGLLVFLLGATGVMAHVVRLIPMPILSGMIGGILLTFPLRIVDASGAEPWIVGAAVLGYLIFYRWINFAPAILGAIVGGVGASAVLGRFGSANLDLAMSFPQVQAPSISLAAVLSVSIPIAILTVGAENMQAIAVLRSIGERPPTTAMTIVSGIATAVAGLFGGHSANVAGPTTAMAASEDAGRPEGKYVAATIAGFTFVAFGLFIPVMVSLIGSIPPALTAVLVGLVLVPTVAGSLRSAWEAGRFTLGVLTAFLVSVSGFTLWGIASAFWAVLFGCLVSVVAEQGDYRRALSGSDK